MSGSSSWSRFVAIGDSFTEGIGDPEPTARGGHRGWADRVAEVLSRGVPDFRYANLAIRGRLLGQILDEQVDTALALAPDLVSCSAGGNDIIRPGSDPDEVAARLETGIVRLRRDGATVIMFPGPDVGRTPVLGRARGRIAIFNENVRAIALRHGAVVADLWAMRQFEDPRMWAPDRLHFSSLGHHEIARTVLDALGVDHDLEPRRPEPLPAVSWREARREDVAWAREHLAPWVVRRIRGRSSGDGLPPKRPDLEPLG